ncbi:MAG: DUF6745 domain-containing protein [Candidatus Hermodarchaeota archaeon]
MINHLTKEQEQQLIEFKQHCLDIGLSTEPIPRNKDFPEIDYIYKNFLNLDPPIKWYVDSPLMLNMLINTFFSSDLEIREKIRKNFSKNFEKIFTEDLIEKLKTNFKTENIYWGNTDIYWIGFYLFPLMFLDIKYSSFEEESLKACYNIVQKTGFVFYFEKICFIIDRPIEIHKKGNLLHKDGGAAVKYKDGYSIWCLNGINVSREIAETPADKLDCKLLLTEKNVEVRREIIRKIGIKRICEDLNAKCIDTYKTKRKYNIWDLDLQCFKEESAYYELLVLNVDNIEITGLKMKNPSLGTDCVEWVPRECKTVKEAIMFRNDLSEFEEPRQLT